MLKCWTGHSKIFQDIPSTKLDQLCTNLYSFSLMFCVQEDFKHCCADHGRHGAAGTAAAGSRCGREGTAGPSFQSQGLEKEQLGYAGLAARKVPLDRIGL